MDRGRCGYIVGWFCGGGGGVFFVVEYRCVFEFGDGLYVIGRCNWCCFIWVFL